MRALQAVAVVLLLTLVAVPFFTKATLGPGVVDSPVAGRFVVSFAQGFLPAEAPDGNLGGLPVVDRIPQIGIVVVHASSLNETRAALQGLQGVRDIAPDLEVRASLVPNDPRYPGQYAAPLLGLPAAWDRAGYGSPAITIAVIDSGVLRTHPDLQGAHILTGHDYVDGDATTQDTCGHGTHVAGILVASTNNGIGVAGTTQATLLPLKVLHGTSSGCSGSMANVAKAIVDATDQGARVISLSLGTASSDATTASAVNYAWQHGALVVAAAGNSGTNSVDYPGAYPEVIAVGAVDSSAQVASYSSRGAKVEVTAPGSSIDSTASDGGYVLMSGTSMATPYVAGTLALALGCAPTTTNQAARDALDATAKDLGTAGRDTSYGYGLARADLLVQRLCSDFADRAPVASFTMAGSGMSRTFDGRGSSDPDGDPLTFAWSFGDGGNSTGPTSNHTYAQPGTYKVRLQVSDGHLDSSSNQTVTVGAVQTFTANFQPTKSDNEWWIEVKVTASATPASVTATANGATHTLTAKSWGTWAASFHVLAGTSITFTATSAGGESVTSPVMTWLPPPSAPPDPQFTATFKVPSNVNEWWVAVTVTGNHPVAFVNVAVDGAAPVALTHQSYGDWTRSMAVQPGSNVQFIATDTSGNVVHSANIPWMASPGSGPFTATITPTQTTNHWWIEAKVSANQPVQIVQVQVNSGPWTDLAKSSWGTWTKSTAVPAGSLVTFRATSTNGSTVLSPTSTWS